VFVTGSSKGINSWFDYATIKYSAVPLSRAHLNFQNANDKLVLSWTNAGFNLQTTPFVTGPFTNLPGATSPFTNPVSGAQRFFRLIQN
jgi:hypothetical protein